MQYELLAGRNTIGLIDMVDLASWYYKNMSFDIYMPEQRGIDAIENYCEILLQRKTSDEISYTVFEEGVIFDDANVKVNAIHTEHMDATTNIAYGFLIEAEGKHIYITGDMHRTLKDFPKELLTVPTDVVITECAHFPAEDLMGKLKGICANQVMVIHVYPTKQYDVLETCKSKTSFELIFPKDGNKYEIE
jgi:hypothetical protein